jgi:hypothetical protein
VRKYCPGGSTRLFSFATLALLFWVACDSPDPKWQVVTSGLPSGLLSVWGSSERDVYIVGSDAGDGRGPAVLHFDGAAWTRLTTGQTGNLWWVFGFAGGPVYMGGEGGVILRYQSGVFTKMTTPGVNTVFGIWGATPDDVWAVGGASGGANGAFAWRLQGDAWVDAPGFPTDLAANETIWKMYGRAANDAWMIGTTGKAVRWDGAKLMEVDTGLGESLFTVHADEDRFVAVGGFGTGAILENDGSGWRIASPSGAPGFNGVFLSPAGDYAVGQEGAVYLRSGNGWTEVETGFLLDETFHSVWIDPKGGVWAVGGQVLTRPIFDGIVLHLGSPIPEEGVM